MPAPATTAGRTDDGENGRIDLINVSKGYGEQWDWQDVILDLSLEIEPGKLTAVVGPSGCGKSTLVNLVAGFEKPEKGRILLDNNKITGPSRDLMVVFQETALMPWMTTYQNLVFGPKVRNDMPADELHEEALRLLDKVGLSDFKDKYQIQLSGGMQRRAELARAMINRPRVLIMDEPFRGLDAMTRELMQQFFLQLFEESRRTHLFVTSEIEEAIILTDKLIILSNRPARVRHTIEIDLPRPRDFSMLNSKQAYEYKATALEILHEEAMKSFKSDHPGQPGRIKTRGPIRLTRRNRPCCVLCSRLVPSLSGCPARTGRDR